MKKIIIVAFVSFLMASCTQTKIGYIDVEEFMVEYLATKDMEADLLAKQKKYAKELDSMQTNFEAKLKVYEKEARRMSASKRAAKEQVLLQERQVLQQREQMVTQGLQKESQESSAKLIKDIGEFVASYSKKNGYNLILGTSGPGTVLYGDENLDLTKDILDKMNKEYEDKK